MRVKLPSLTSGLEETRSKATERVDSSPLSVRQRAGKGTSAHIHGSVQVIGTEAFSYVFLVIE